MRRDEINSFIDAMEDMGDEWEVEDVERVYGNMSLEEALEDRRNDLYWFGGIISNILNFGND